MKDGYRHEYKYWISRQSADLLRRQLPHLLRPDPHVGPTGQYTIRSLYFDDPAYSAYYEKVNGVRDRAKYRIRCYNYNFDILKLEKKEKHGALTKKTAQSISRRDAQVLCHSLLDHCPDQPGPLTEELRLACCGRALRPMVLVDYDRTPFVSICGNTRITLDENLRTRVACSDLEASEQALIPVLQPNQAILEVKFDDFIPAHFLQVLNAIPKTPMAISKFPLCMDVSYNRKENYREVEAND